METQKERRREPKRITTKRTVALLGKNGEDLITGTTNNMSDAGIGARFDALPEMDSDVMLRLYWHPEQAPIEQRADLVWHTPESGEGVSAGFRLVEMENDLGSPKKNKKRRGLRSRSISRNAKEDEDPLKKPPFIEQGTHIWLQKGGVAIRAEVASIGDIQEDNTVELLLHITDPAFSDQQMSTDDDPASPELVDFTPHPFRDAWLACEKYLGPVVRLLIEAASRGAAVAGSGLRRFKAYLVEKKSTRHHSA